MPTVSAEEIRAYYSAALAGLRFVEARRPTGRRFGDEADARWARFRGDLATADRLDVLIRDADAEWPGAFGARVVFAEPAVAEDDAFGPAWSSLSPVDAEEVWRALVAGSFPSEPQAFFDAWSRAWGMRLRPFEIGAISAADRLVLAGPSAIAAAIRVFSGRSDLAWSEQVAVFATPPAHRQLAAVAGAILNATWATPLFTHTQGSAAGGGRTCISEDASNEDAEAARRG